MTKEQKAEAKELLHEATMALDKAVEAFDTLASFVADAGDQRLAGEIEGYTLGNLKMFLDDTDYTGRGRQSGSVNSIQASLDEEDEE